MKQISQTKRYLKILNKVSKTLGKSKVGKKHLEKTSKN